MNAEAPDPSLPRVLGSYRLLEVIGEGGMGVVYGAVHLPTGDRVALKTVKRADRRMLSAMRSEIAGLRSIHHPGVVRILAEGEDDGLPWYAMQMLEGRTLSLFNASLWRRDGDASSPSRTTSVSGETDASTLTSSPSPEAPLAALGSRLRAVGPAAAGSLHGVLSLYRALCAPLAYIHGRGIVHRDLKPSNIWLESDGAPVLMDFGLVSYAKGSIGREILRSGQKALGTLNYVSPEQIQGRLVDARADLYSLGCMLYESLTGRPPFDGSKQDVLARHLGERPVPPSDLVDGIAPSLDRLVLGLLAKQPQQRIGHADDVAAALGDLLGDQGKPSTSVEPPAYLYRPQLAGREDALAALTDLWSQAEAGHGALVLLGGESGIGKTFVTAEFAQRMRQRNVRVVTGECVPVAVTGGTANEAWAGEPLHPLRGLFQAMADTCREGGPAVTGRILGVDGRGALLAPYMATATPAEAKAPPTESVDTSDLPAKAARERLLECLAETVAAFAAEDPLLLLVDDLQWADDLTIAFLASLSKEFFEGRRLLIAATYRSEEVGDDLRRLVEGSSATGLPLHRLDRGVVASIVADMLAIPTPPDVLTSFLAKESEGNPFFVGEYLRLLVADGVLVRQLGQWRIAESRDVLGAPSGEVPRSIQALVSKRLARLDETARGLIEAASVLGREFELDVLAAATKMDRAQVGAAVREAAKRQVVEEIETGRVRFMHDKLREAAYEGIPAERLTVLHRAAAVAIEEACGRSGDFAPSLPDLAHHYLRAGDRRKAIDFLDRAGVEAQRKSANKDAIAFFKEALQQAASLGRVDKLRTARWHRQIADAHLGLGRLQESSVHAREAAAQLGWPSPTQPARLGLSLLGQISRQVAHRLRPARFLRSRRDETEVLVEAARAHSRLLEGAYFKGDVLVMFHACVATLNLTELADTSPELTTAYGNAFVTASVLPARRLAEAYSRQAHENLARHPDAEKESHLNMVGAVYRTGMAHWPEASAEIEHGLGLARSLRFSRRLEELWSLRSISSFLRGDLEQALASADAVCQSAVRGNLQILCWGTAEKAQALLAKNEPAEALAALDTVAPLLSSPELGRTERLWVHALTTRAAVRKGDFALAAVAAEDTVKEVLAGPPISFAWIDAYASITEGLIALWSEAQLHGGAGARRYRALAKKVSGQLKPLARLFPAATPCRELWRGHYQWQLGRYEPAVQAWEASLTAARQLKMPHDEALALLALGTRAAAGDAERRTRLAAAASIFRELGAEHGLELTRAAMAGASP